MNVVFVVAVATLLGLVLILLVGAGQLRSPASPGLAPEADGHDDLDWVRERGVEGLDRLLRLLFAEMGFAPEGGHRGRSSVDFQANDPTPIRGGRILIHGTLGTAAGVDADDVRAAIDAARADLLGKAVLVTLGRFTSDARDAARDQPIDLVDGEALADLVKKHLPQAWATRAL